MGASFPHRENLAPTFAWNEFTGAVGDSVTVLPLVVALSVLTDLSLSFVLLWFGIFQIVWGLYYAAPMSVEPMKALAALVLAGTVSTTEALVAGLFLGVVLLGVGRTNSLARVSRYIGSPVVRGVQFGVALVLLETGLQLSLSNPGFAGIAAVVAVAAIALGRWKVSALAVLLVGGGIAAFHTGVPSPTLPSMDGLFLVDVSGVTMPAFEAASAQIAMTVGNAALATSVLMSDYFDRDISADELASSMGVMNLAAVPFGAFPMCHGSGGVAGKYAFGARTAAANVILGVGYLLVALVAVELVAAYPLAMLGVVLAIIALQLARTSIRETEAYVLVAGIGVLGVVVNLGVAFVVGIVVWLMWERRRGALSWLVSGL
ncbi:MULTISPECIES: putative sulfate/molybdate transporter [Haloferax]|uniref:Sulfate transporter n=1 Tax=Haloferax marinum TaxID=2666143 RepID=A0A6A8G8P5_9EURY|nr:MULTISPECIES: putative sulfate/molybdate transporter [Haloferax]KAB1198346.1 sulfate transporter [Haloferax sp. CBA1150]MRW97444.1 sulfate transporter [Haloferax marinum]